MEYDQLLVIPDESVSVTKDGEMMLIIWAGIDRDHELIKDGLSSLNGLHLGSVLLSGNAGR